MKTMSDKVGFRQFAFAKMKKRYPYKIASSKKVMHSLKRIITSHDPQSILFYYPLGHEMDLRPLMYEQRAKRKTYLPFMVDDSFKMVAYRLPLRRAKYGIIEPKNSRLKINKVDMIIVPIVGVDRHYKRIGFGKGMYDRFVERLDNKPLIIFVQSTLCYTQESITDAYDIKADYIVTPKDFLHIEAKRHDKRNNSRRYRIRS